MPLEATSQFAQVFRLLKENADPHKRVRMRAYMRNQFEFLGVPTPKRRALTKDSIRALKKHSTVDWEFVDQCWDSEYRELQYVAVDYLQAIRQQLTLLDIDRIRFIAQKKSWWDTIDGLDGLLGTIALRYPEAKGVLLDWSMDGDFWLRRIAIDHQLGLKQKTDNDLLEKIIINNLGQTEFFINKAIGWTLREYSKTDPEWVRSFLERHGNRMAKLSVREASKYL